jgi:hypothetical protein
MIKLNERELLEALKDENLELIETLVNEAIQNSNFSTTDKKRMNAFKALAKKYKRSLGNNQPKLAGAFLNEDDLLTLCNGYLLIIINEKSLANCDMIKNDVEKIKTLPLFDKKDYKSIEININDVLNQLKPSKTKKEKLCVYKMNEIWFNADYFKSINDILDLTLKTTTMEYKSNVSPIFFENENGRALLLPIRQTN